MRIAKISVKGLFGYLDHEIPLNQESRITIIHGPNGVGKTVLMSMVDSIFHCNYDFLKRTPFNKVNIQFENEYSIEIDKKCNKEEFESEVILNVIYINSSGEKVNSFGIQIPKKDIFHRLMKKYHPELVPVFFSPSSVHQEITVWIAKDDIYMGESRILKPITKQEILRREPQIHTEAYGELPDWYTTIQQEVSPKNILISRLKSATWDHQFYASWKWNRNTLNEEDAIYMIPSHPDAVTEIPRKLTLNSSLMEMIDLRDRFIREKEELQSVLDDGVVRDREVTTELLEERIEFYENQLAEYNTDIEYQAVELLCELMNQRILFKYLQLDGEAGIKAYFDGVREVPLATLSSGEQQLLVLYYQLLFETEPNTLVMIDEPEISMNIVWQRNFLKDLQRIVELRGFDVLIATHSPQIIHDKWDWVVALGAKADD